MNTTWNNLSDVEKEKIRQTGRMAKKSK